MNRCKLLEVSEMKNVSVKPFEGELEYVATGDVDGNIISSSTLVTYEDKPSRANIKAELNHILFAKMKDTNKVLRINEEMSKKIYSTGFCVLEAGDKITPEFLEIAIKSDYFQRQKNKYSKGATQKAINNEGLKKIEIPLPSLQIQKKIVEVLDKAQELIALRKKQIQLLDELIQSVFYDMFGDLIANSKDWPMMAFAEFSSSRLGKMLDKKNISGNHLKKYLGNSNVKWFKFELENLKEMDFDEKEQQKFSLKKGDLLICEGGEVGRCAIWNNELCDCYFQKALHRVRVDLNIIIPEYLQYVMWFYALKGGFKDYSTSATIAHLTGVKLKKMEVPVPDIKLQNQFAQKVQKIEEQKQLMSQSLIEMENNFNSLMQKAFKGELFK